MKNSRRSTSAINPVTTDNTDDSYYKRREADHIPLQIDTLSCSEEKSSQHDACIVCTVCQKSFFAPWNVSSRLQKQAHKTCHCSLPCHLSPGLSARITWVVTITYCICTRWRSDHLSTYKPEPQLTVYKKL